METESSSRVHKNTGPYLELDGSSPHDPILCLDDSS
jgi:hypothetical protein